MSHALHNALEASFDEAFNRVAAGWRLVGVAAGLSTESGLMIERHAGVRRVGTPDLIRSDDVWHIGSISKGFTAALAMRLQEKGVLNIDMPLDELLPRWASDMDPDWQKITLAQLLSHTSGAPVNLEWREFWGYIRFARLEAARQIWKSQPVKPGKYRYSNAGYVLAGCIMEELTETEWEQLIVEEVTKPLGLHSVMQGAPPSPAPWGHEGLMRRTSVNPKSEFSDNAPVLGPAGRMSMRISDLLEWGRQNLRMIKGRSNFLSHESAQRLHRPVANDYGLGWVIIDNPGGVGTPVHMHDGSNTLWHAHLAVLPEKEAVIALCFNTGNTMRAQRGAFQLLKAITVDAQRMA